MQKGLKTTCGQKELKARMATCTWKLKSGSSTLDGLQENNILDIKKKSRIVLRFNTSYNTPLLSIQ